MKRINNKVLISTLAISIFAIIFSCSKKTEINISNQKIATVNNLSKSPSFKKFVALLNDIEYHLNNSPQLSYSEKNQLKTYLNASSITESQLTIVAKLTGFNSVNDFMEIFKTQDAIKSELKSEFININSISPDSLFEAISIVHNMNAIKYKIAHLSPEEQCRKIYNNCSSRASATYSAAILGCTATAIGVGAGTALVGGVIFQVGCGGLSYWYLLLQRDECALNYEACLKK